jgi:2-polyprenyl-6-methoxyphenol hydroxylase-like FAD-dependent oxidoreductase
VRIRILGTGLEALATALVLRHNGCDDLHLVTTEAGSTAPVVELPPNGSRVLYALGLRDVLENTAAAPQMEHRRTADTGYLLQQRPLGHFAQDRYKAPHLTITTSAVTTILRDALGDIEVHDAATAEVDLTIDVAARNAPQQDCGAAATPWTFSWHSTSSFGNNVTSWLAGHQYFRQIPTPEGTFGLHVGPPIPHPRFAALSGTNQTAERHAVLDHSPRGSWINHRHVLLGSAAHPLLPFTNQDFALTLEDAWVLARMLDGFEDDVDLALLEYQRYRLPRATRVQRFAREQGRLAMESGRLAQMSRNLRFALGYWFVPEMALGAEDWIYEYDCLKGFD